MKFQKNNITSNLPLISPQVNVAQHSPFCEIWGLIDRWLLDTFARSNECCASVQLNKKKLMSLNYMEIFINSIKTSINFIRNVMFNKVASHFFALFFDKFLQHFLNLISQNTQLNTE